MLGGLSIWTSSFSKRKMNYSWTATLFFLSGIENGEGQWNINNPLYIWAHDTFCVLPWYAQNKRPISQFLKAAQDHFHFLLSEELEEITLWVYHSLSIFLNLLTHYHMCFCFGCVQLLLCLHSVLMNPCPKLRGSCEYQSNCASKLLF